MPSILHTLDEVLKKAQRLAEICDILGQEKELLLLENNLLKQDLTQLETQNQALEKQLETLRLSKKLEGDQVASQDLKIKINDFVREIDQCILMLKKH